MKVEAYDISLLVFGLFLTSAFFPMPQLMLSYANGYLIGSVERLMGLSPETNTWFFNSLLMNTSLWFYFTARRVGHRLLLALLASFFLNALVILFFDKHLLFSEYYWMKYWVGAFMIGIVLMVMDLLR